MKGMKRLATAWRSPPAAFAFAILGPVLLTVLLGSLNTSQSRDYAFLYLAVVAALGVSRGIGPALAAALVSFLLIDYFFVAPVHTLTIADETDLVNLVVLLAAAGLVGSLGSRRRLAQIRAEQLAEKLRQTTIELENLNREQAAAAAVAVRLAQTQQQVHVLEQTDRLRRELLANVSHELRTPLGTILTGVSSQAEREDLPDDIREELQAVVRETQRLGRLVSDMLDLARIEGHALKINVDEVDLADAIEGAGERLRRVNPTRVVKMELPAGCEVVADWDRLGQIFDNLLGNADRFSPAGAPVTVEASAGKRAMVVIRVTDAGPGVAAADREHIFERFFRPESGATDHRSGTGLGLAIARGLVEAHGGRIWVEDPPANSGARFAFTLPAADSDDSPAEP
jgi:K+-sensing histidine kinase KdpD